MFFFPAPPPEEDPKTSFRTLPDFEIEDLQPDTRLKVRQARALQLSLAELNDGRNPAEQKIFIDLHVARMPYRATRPRKPVATSGSI